MVCGFSGAGADCAVGRSSLIACVNSGAVMMKITSNTSITSTIGVTLMSAIGAGCLVVAETAEAHAGLLEVMMGNGVPALNPVAGVCTRAPVVK